MLFNKWDSISINNIFNIYVLCKIIGVYVYDKVIG